MANKVKISINTKMITLLTVLILGSLTAFLVFAVDLFNKDKSAYIFESALSTTKMLGGEISSYLNNVETTAALITNIAVGKKGQNDFAENLLTKSNNVIEILLYKKEGKKYLKKLNLANGKLLKEFRQDKKNLRDFLKLSPPPWERIQSQRKYIVNNLSIEQLPHIMLAVWDEKSRSILMMRTLISSLENSFSHQKIYKNFLFDFDRQMFIGSAEEKFRPDKNLLDKLIAREIDKGVQEIKIGESMYLLGYNKINDLGLMILSIISKDEAFAAAKMLINKSVYLSIFLMSGAIFLGVYFSRSISRPILNLRNNAETITGGNLDNEVKATTSDEIGVLAWSFDRMRLAIKKKLHELHLLDIAGKDITKIHTQDTLLNFSLEKAMELAEVTSGKVFLLHDIEDSDEKELVLESTYPQEKEEGEKGEEGKEKVDPKPNSTNSSNFTNNQDAEFKIAQEALSKKRSIIGSDNIVGIPLEMDNEYIGVMTLRERADGEPFTGDKIKPAEALSGAIAISLKNIELLELTKETTRLEAELETTRMVQSMFFPTPKAEFKDCHLYGFAEPATECGGDLWGYFKQDEDIFYVFVGDATGHGVPAALVTAVARGSFYIVELELQSGKVDNSPKAMMEVLNHAVYNTSKQKVMMTFFLAKINEKDKTMTFTNAGHNFPFLLDHQKKKIVPVLAKEAQGPRLGFEPGYKYEESVMPLDDPFALFAFTDGLVEAVDPNGAEYGDKKLRRLLKKNMSKGLDDMYEVLTKDMDDFRQGTPLEDDNTWFILQSKNIRTPES